MIRKKESIIMYHWICIIYRKPIAALNTLWHFVETNPRKPICEFTLFCDYSQHKQQFKWFQEQVNILLKYHQKTAPKFNEQFMDEKEIDMFRQTLKRMGKFLKGEKASYQPFVAKW